MSLNFYITRKELINPKSKHQKQINSVQIIQISEGNKWNNKIQIIQGGNKECKKQDTFKNTR
jgi:hypothetical protein